MKIVFTRHAADKFTKLPPGSVKVKEEDVLEAIKNPDYQDTESDKPKIIVHKSLDIKHIVRVVYKRSLRSYTSKEENDIITVITFYPTKKGRYEK
ncbi:hypothetical protein A3J19_02605 [Candidatus Daviesbacteria bacterium RIFCSPLOWO2_02_FULL_41_8]|uniref:DUF4258 domain-containing protein n=3 Tax=Candidatus Daviesiibacteriota TaxID=1752718 RepID=A0A1F5NLF7_9BACT|nr:MAG: hypothetical protein A2871_03405 [Candidatus Daviesbacteria bacterium RIFCSPHIGHO2_01_FULL_41_23]OGE32450.1 MAG: hypothetical protein A3D83_02245 [Candidatus Daviesbacteria bacterium RIFCSPHIGHO2_02_FULL_41_10]OGE61970.1 MAG: hypothetical protein A2967_03220 [Candidatus Daviesbacteria bacterium RIFCSPLOWO2_01_FULL_41_32]OGE78495.1 MAG: hypothetical protein A3J19_02605 [Candidatus Daviesbacteria bacterium RIFCSPLOWO2_02_FULL_41_8]